MKRKIIFALIIWVMFLIPFLILSSHLKNSIKSMAITTSLYRIDIVNSSVASYSASLLENEYNIFFGFEKKIPLLDDIVKFLSSKKGSILRGFAIYNEDLKKIYNNDFSNSDGYKNIIETLKRSDLPAGVVEYPNDKPADLILGKKIGGFYVLCRTDLGYLISKVMQRISRTEGIFYIVDGDFNVIYDSLYSYLLDRNVLSKEVEDLIKNMIKQSNFNYRGIIKIGSSDFLISIYNIENTKWWSIAVLDTSEVSDAELSNWAKRVISSGVVLMFVFSWIVVIISKKFII